MNSNPKAYDWTLLGMEIENYFLNHSKPNTWAHQRCIRMINIKGQKFTDACPPSVSLSHFKQILKDHKQGSSLPSASLTHFIIIKVQAYQILSILNRPRRSKRPNFASLHIWFATSWLNLKFHVSMFLWILKIHVAFDVLCSCIYLKKKKKSKNIKISKSFPKKEKNFQKKKKKSLD